MRKIGNSFRIVLLKPLQATANVSDNPDGRSEKIRSSAGVLTTPVTIKAEDGGKRVRTAAIYHGKKLGEADFYP